MMRRPYPAFATRFLGHPLLWLLVLSGFVLLRLDRQQLLEPVRSPDAVSYEIPAAADSLEELLSAVRTSGYPLLLRFIGPEEENYAFLPLFHALAFLAAAAFFWLAVRVYAESGWLAFSASLPLLLSGLLRYPQWIQPDVLAPVFAVVSVSLLLFLAVRPDSLVRWVGLTATIFLTYQMRPDYLFLVAFVPLLGPLLRWCRDGASLAVLKRWTLGLAASTLLPLILFCSVRWLAVGQFGLVSFGGYNLVGITACFLDQDLVAELPLRQQQLATEILEARRSKGWQPLRVESVTPQWRGQYGKNVWAIAEPLARPIVVRERQMDHASEAGRDAMFLEKWGAHGAPPLSGAISIAVNDRLSELSWEIIKRRPWLYGKWVHDSLLFGFDQALVVSTWMRWLPVLIVLSLPLVVFRLADDRHLRENLRSPLSTSQRRLLGICLLALSFFLAKLSLMVLVNWAQERFMVGALVFVPGALAAVLFELWRVILAPFSAESA